MQSLEENRSLKTLNTFGISVNAKYLLPFSNEEELQHILETDLFKKEKHFVLGGGSNILFTQDVNALVLKNEIHGKEFIKENEDHVWVRFGAGEIWHNCVLWAIEKNLSGIENLSLIPGTVGAAPMQNIGAYGVEVKSVIDRVEAIEKSTGKRFEFSKDECEFAYRESIFKRKCKDQFVITRVIFRLNKKHSLQLSYGAIQSELETRGIVTPTIKDVSDIVIAIRESKLPNPQNIGNAGSFFKNPVVDKEFFARIQVQYPTVPFYEQGDAVKIPAGWLIEQAGWKGFRDGEIGVHEKQALVLVNYGKGRGLDIYNLSEKIINDVKTRYGIELQREVNVL